MKSLSEKLARAVSHNLYLEELFPRSLNVAKHIKSMEFRHSEGCFDILKEASDKLVSNQLRKWDLHLGQLSHQKDVYMEKLCTGLCHELKHEKP